MLKNPLTPTFSQFGELFERFFDPLGPQLDFQKSSPNWLKVGVREIFYMGNMNLKEFFDFDNGTPTRVTFLKWSFSLNQGQTIIFMIASAMREIDSPTRKTLVR
jgi:hypothetical protein